MDSFKYYSYSDGKAYNYDTAPYSYALDITEATIDDYVNGDDDDDDQYYDEYHDRDCEDITYVHYHGREISCDSENLEDFTWIDRRGAYYHEDDIVFAVDTQKYEVKEDCFYSELIDDYYYDEDKFKAAEKAYIEKNWFWSEIDQDYGIPKRRSMKRRQFPALLWTMELIQANISRSMDWPLITLTTRLIFLMATSS